MDITGRKLFVKALQEEGVTTLFGYPGGTVTDLFDELYKQDGIEVVLPRHEQGLIHEAEGYARSTGKSGSVSGHEWTGSHQYHDGACRRAL